MTYQQLAMSRVRAVEHGRAVVVAATSGVSAIIAPDGAVTSQTDLFVPAALVAKVPLSTSSTLASRVGPVPEIVLSIMRSARLPWQCWPGAEVRLSTHPRRLRQSEPSIGNWGCRCSEERLRGYSLCHPFLRKAASCDRA